MRPATLLVCACLCAAAGTSVQAFHGHHHPPLATRAAVQHSRPWWGHRSSSTALRQTIPGPSSEGRTPAQEAAYLRELEQEYWNSLDPEAYTIAQHQTVGLQMLMAGALDDALAAYDKALAVGPGRHLWHRGLTLYYLGRHDDAAEQLSRDALTFESAFDDSATDERLWAAAAAARAAAAAGAPPPPVPPLALREGGALKAALHALFTVAGAGGGGDGGDGGEALERVRALMPASGVADPSGRAFFGDFYLGLWHDAAGRDAEAREHMTRARDSTFPGEGDLWAVLPRLHMRVRGWE